MAFTLAQLAQQLGAEVHGDGTREIRKVATLEKAGEGEIAFLSNKKYRHFLEQSKATAVLITEADLQFCPTNALVLKDPYVGFARVAQLLDTTPQPAMDIHPSAVIAADVQLGERVAIGANAVIESGVVLGDDVRIGPGCFVGKDTRLGARSRLWANVTLYHNVTLGTDCLVQAGTVIGADGFGYANERGEWLKIPQLGGVTIGNRVEIGACTTIDRARFGRTWIGEGTKIDNLVQIGHNCVTGKHCIIVSQTGISGSTRLGDYVTMGGQVGVAGHLEIASQVMLLAKSGVTKSLTEPGAYTGFPAKPLLEGRRMLALPAKIPDLIERVRELERKLAALEEKTTP